MSDSGHFPPANSPDWLPAGWSVEVRSNNGKNVKSYVDQLTGYRYYSKPKVLEYLRTRQNYSWRSQTDTAGSRYDINLPQNLNETPGLLPHRSVAEIPFWENGSQSRNNIYEPTASESLHSGEIKAEKSPDWLPPGWTEEVKVRDGQIVKTYVDPLWGHRFYTKPQVLQYLGVVTNDSSTSQKETASNNSETNLLEKISATPEPLPHVSTLTTAWEDGSQSKLEASEMSHSSKIVYEKNPDWLPTGWTVEVNIRNGRSYKSYVDSLTGRRFYSKPKVLEYLGTANNVGGTSETKKMGNDFDINLPVDIDDTLESLHHVRITELETGENGSQSAGKSFKLPLKTIDSSKPLPDGWIIEVKTGKDGSASYKSAKRYIDPVTGRKFNSKKKVFEYLESVQSDSATSQQKETVLNHVSNSNVDKTEGVTPSQQLVESQNGDSFNNSIHLSMPKETISRKKPVKKPNTAQTVDAIPPPPLVESQDVRTLDSIHLSTSKDTSSRKRPLRKPNMGKIEGATPPPQLVESQIVKTLSDPIHPSTSKESTSRNRRGKKLNWDKQAVESQNVETLNHNGLASLSKETSCSKQAGTKVPEGLPPGWITEIKIKKTGNKTKKLPYYIDPVSGYVFSSKTDAWCYLEAGDISKCVIKPRKREEMGFTIKRNSPNMDNVGSNTHLQLLEEPQHVSMRKRMRFSPEVEKLSTSKECDSEVVIERVAAEELPSGWIKEVKIEKFYTDPRTGYVFMSQKDALLYLETGDIGTCAVKPRSRDELGLNEGSTPKMNKTGGELPMLQLEQSQNEITPRRTRLSSQQNEMSSSKQSGGKAVERVAPIELHLGPIKESNIQKKAVGTRRDTPKMDKSRGKPALQQLEQSEAVNTPEPASFPSPEKEATSFKHNGIETVLERVAPTGLPPGWIKEIRSQKKADGIRKDTFYSDPVSGYVFSSQKDVIRFVKTGDIRSCAMRPKQREALGFNQGSFTMSPAVVQNPGHDTAKKQLSTDKKTGAKRSLETMDPDVSQKRRETRSSITSPAVVQKVERATIEKQLSTGKIGSGRSLEIMDSDVSQKRRQTRSAATPAVIQKLGSDTTEKQLSTGRVGSGRSLEIMDSDVSQKRRQTRSAATPAVMQKPGSDTTEKQLSTATVAAAKEVGSKKSLETMESDVSQKRRQTRASAASPSVVRKPGRDKGEKHTFIGKKVGSKRSLEITESEVSQKRRQTRLSARVVAANGPIDELPKEVPKLESMIQKPTSNEKGRGSNRKPLPNTKVKADILKIKNVRSPSSAENLEVKNVSSPPSAKNSKANNVKKSAIEKSSTKNNHSPATKKKETKKQMRTPPSRVSKRISGVNTETLPNSVSSEQDLPSKLEKSGEYKNIPKSKKKEGIAGPNAPNNIVSSKKTPTSEVENSGEKENTPCPNPPDNVAENASQQLETVSEMGDIEVEKSGQNKDIQCPVAPVDVFSDAPEELETVSEMGKTDNALGGAEALLNTEVLNKSSEAAGDQDEDQTVSQEQPYEVSNKREEAMDQDEDQTISQEQLSEVANKTKEAMEEQKEDQTVSHEQPSELSNKSKEAMEDQTVSQEQPTKVSNKSNEAMGDQVEEQTISQPTEVSNKSEAMEDHTEYQTVSQEQTSELSNKNEAVEDQAKDQTMSQEQLAEVSNKSEAIEDQTEDQSVTQKQPSEMSNKSEDAIGDQVKEQTISQEQPIEVSNKSEAMEGQPVTQDQPVYQFGEETWSDPCLDFAFKTLTGTLPFEDNVPVPNIFQSRGDISQVKTSDNALTILDFGAQADNSHAHNGSEALCQVDNYDTQNGSGAPTNASVLPDMNSSLPSGSENAPQQNDWEENRNNDKNELTLDNYARFLF